jgi:aspartate/methionine/tyrosine aminotransferase
MVRARAAYMEWAKRRPGPKIDLAGSNLLACTLEDLPGAREAIDLAGESAEGYLPLVQAIANRYGVSPDRVATAGGCSGANFLACAALLDAGDEVLIESPHYDPLAAAARMLGGQVMTFPRRFEEGYRIDSEEIATALTSRTRLIIVSNPHNPSGVLASEEELEGLRRLAELAGVSVLFDEVYLDTVAGPPIPPAATRSPFFVSTNSLTKAYGLSSLRCGWTLASAEVTEKIRRARDVVDVYGPMPADRLAVVAFQNIDRLGQRARRIIDANSRLVSSFFAAQTRIQSVPSRSTLAFPRFENGADAGPFVKRLFETYGVAVVPGSFFDFPAHFRIAYGGSTSKAAAGLDAIARCLEQRASRHA